MRLVNFWVEICSGTKIGALTRYSYVEPPTISSDSGPVQTYCG
jgi:hypothetical protein